MRDISLFSEVSSLRVDKKALAALIATLDSHFHAPEGTLSIAFLTHDHLARMHGEFCGDPSPTDIITFPSTPSPSPLPKGRGKSKGAVGPCAHRGLPWNPLESTFGELCISPQAAVEYILKKNPKLSRSAKLILDAGLGCPEHRRGACGVIREHRSSGATTSCAKSNELGAKFEEEMRRYVIHGYLHLLGYDDLEPKKKREMRRMEKRSLLSVKKIKKIFSWK